MKRSEQQWLKAVPWDSVLALNKALCQAQKTDPLNSLKGFDPARRLWETAIQSSVPLLDALDVCHQCHALGPFMFNNGNTFAAIGRTLIEDCLKPVPPVEAQIIRTTVCHYIVGLISGGVAPNVVSPSAQAELMFRTVGDTAEITDLLARFESRVSIEPILEVPPVMLTTVPGIETAVFPYTTDIPFLHGWGKPLLFGPGSIHVAHTADEHIEIAEQQAAVDKYVALARELLEKANGPHQLAIS